MRSVGAPLVLRVPQDERDGMLVLGQALVVALRLLVAEGGAVGAGVRGGGEDSVLFDEDARLD